MGSNHLSDGKLENMIENLRKFVDKTVADNEKKFEHAEEVYNLKLD